MGIAAGLAASGYTVFASSFAMFAAGRAFEQVRNSIGYPHLNVKIGSQNNDKVLEAPVKFAGGTTTTTSETQVNGTLKSSSNSIELKTNGLVAGMWVIVPGVRVDYR